MTRAIRSGDRSALIQAESRGLELATALVLPATLGLFVLSEPIIRVLFEHGAFTAADTVATARALSILALGLPAHVLVKVLAPAFFAREDTKTPLVATIVGVVLAVICGLVFRTRLWRKRRRRQHLARRMVLRRHPRLARRNDLRLLIDAVAWRRLPRIAICAAVMGVMLFLAESFVAPVTADAGFAARITILGGLVAAGVSFYGLLLDLFGVINWGEAISNLRDGRLRE